jgi:hypothetical protein
MGVAAGLPERHVPQQQGGLVLAGLALQERGRLAENLGVVLAVDGDGDLRRVGEAREFNFEVEPRVAQNIGPVDRIDRLRRSVRSCQGHRKAGRRRKHSAHVEDPPMVQGDQT